MKRMYTKMCGALAAAMSFALVACTQPATPTKNADPRSTKTVLTILDYTDTSDAKSYAWSQKIYKAFADANPDIDVQVEYKASEAYFTRLAELDKAGTLPDVMFLWPTGRTAFILENHKTKDLSTLLPSDLLSKFPSSIKDTSKIAGGYLGMMPRGVTCAGVLYVNKKLLADNGLQPATTYAQMKAQVATLKAKGIDTLGFAGMETWVHQSCLMSTMIGRMLGNGFLPATMSRTGYKTFSGPEFVGVLNAYKTMIDDGVISATMANLNYGDAPGKFAQGKIAYYLDGDWRAGAFMGKTTDSSYISDERLATDFDIMPLPSFDGESNPGCAAMNLGTGWGISSAVAAGSAKEEAAIRLFKYFYGKEFLTAYLEEGIGIPLRSDVTSTNIKPLVAKQLEFCKANTNACYVFDSIFDPSVCDPLNAGLKEILEGTKTPQQVGNSVETAMAAWRAKQ